MKVNYDQQKNLLVLILLVLSSFTMVLTVTNYLSFTDKKLDNNQSSNSSNSEPTAASNQPQTNPQINTLLSSNTNMFFEQNVGQLGIHDVAYYFSSKSFKINFLPSKVQFNQINPVTGNEISYSISFIGSTLVTPVATQQLSRYNNYFIGNERFTNVPLFKDLIYYDIYSGIDLHYYFSGQGLKYDFIVHPGANPNQISIQSSSNTYFTATSSSLAINDALTGHNLLMDNNLFVYQNINSNTQTITSSFVLKTAKPNIASYNIGTFDRTHNLIIDPVLVVNTSTYLGGNNDDSGNDMVMDSQHNFYITGSTFSSNFPTANAINSTYGSLTDIFIMKLNSTGTGIIWSTYFSGNGDDVARRIALDNNSNVVIVGYTNSTNLPLQPFEIPNVNGTAFIVSLSNDGQTLKLCSLLGGVGTVDGESDAYGLYIPQNTTDYYITGYTCSENFSTTLNAYNRTYGGYCDAYFLKMSNTGTTLYSSFIGGSEYDEGDDIAVDSLGNTYVVGDTNSNLTGLTLHSGFSDIFITKFASNGTLIHAELIGGLFGDIPTSIALNNDFLYITGYTYSQDFPVNASSFDTKSTSIKSFVMKLNPSGLIDYSTFFGGNTSTLSVCVNTCVFTYSNKILVDSIGEAIIAGNTNANNMPLLDEYKKQFSGGSDAFITTFNAEGTNITYSTYLGGSDYDQIFSFVLGPKNEIYLTGETSSLNYPVNNAIQPSIGYYGNSDAFFTKLSLDYITPTLSIKPDFNYSLGSTGNKLTFLASDNDPEAYYIIYKDGVSVQTGPLQTDKVSYSVDGLTLGAYNYTVLVQDRTGNKVSKTTMVTVYQGTTNTNSSIPVSSSTKTNGGSLNQLLIDLIIILILGSISAVAASLIVRNRMDKGPKPGNELHESSDSSLQTEIPKNSLETQDLTVQKDLNIEEPSEKNLDSSTEKTNSSGDDLL